MNIELNKAVFFTYLIAPHQLSSGCQKNPMLYTDSKYLVGFEQILPDQVADPLLPRPPFRYSLIPTLRT